MLTADGTHTYSWDAEGRLLTVDGGTEAYAYNVLGQRVQKRVSGVYTNSAHDAFGRLIYHDTGTSQSQIFQWLDNKMIGYYTTWERYAHTNALGSVTALTDVNGNLYQEEQFFPWGQQWTGSIEDDHFAGMDKHDTETGLDPTLFRMFSSNQGRWLSPDPLAGDITNPQSLNRYAYVLNNPASLVDPLGLNSIGTSWTGQCTPNGYTSGCSWNGGAMSNTIGQNGSCMAGEYGCDSSSSFGDDIFDKLAAFAPGSGFIPVSRGAAGDCPGCYYNPDTDQTWNPSEHDPASFFAFFRTPANGPPGSTVRLPKPGGFQDRTYGPDGRAIKDIDHGHDHGSGDPHVHDWDWSKKPPRQPHVPLTPEEKAALKTAAVEVGVGAMIWRAVVTFGVLELFELSH